jgi:hypothetical protein
MSRTTLRRAGEAHAPRVQAAPRTERESRERPLWQVVVVLYAGLVLLAAGMMALAFVIAWLVTGVPY